MLSQEDLVRRCAYAVAVVTGVDPYEHRNEIKGDDALQISRKLWVHLLAAEFGMSNAEAARMLARKRETVIINLGEVEDWRDRDMHPRAGDSFDRALDQIGEALRGLVDSGMIAASSAPTQIERSRIRRRGGKGWP